jgi:hypothetical protein
LAELQWVRTISATRIFSCGLSDWPKIATANEIVSQAAVTVVIETVT